MDPTRWPLARSPAPAAMKALIGLLIAATLLIAVGCAKQDWIDRTLVTVDVTGTRSGNTGGTGYGSSADFRLELEQQGSTVRGFLRLGGGSGGQSGRFGDGPIEGTVTGDVFRFKEPRGGFEGELTVSGDEMTGTVSSWGQRRLSLRRIDPSAPPASPPR